MLGEGAAHSLSEHHGTVSAAGAAKCDRQITFSFLNVVRNQKKQQTFDALSEIRQSAGTNEYSAPPSDLCRKTDATAR